MTTTTPREKFHEAIDQQDIWKAPEMKDFAVALVGTAVKLLLDGQLRFSTDDVPETQHPQSPGVAGSVIEKLKNASVIEPVGKMIEGKWYPERIRSKRPEAKGRYISIYQLCSLHNGAEFLRRNHKAIIGQLDLLARDGHQLNHH